MGTDNYSAISNNNEVGTLAVDGWAVTFGTASMGLGVRPGPLSLYYNSPPINGQCTNHRIAVQWSVALRF